MYQKRNKVLSWFWNHREYIFLILVLAFFSFVCLYKIGSVSFTGDESTDYNLVSCNLRSFNNLFSCNDDITQTRFPYYINVIAYILLGKFFGLTTYYLVSFVFSLFFLVYTYIFLRKEFGRNISLISLLLMATSIPILTSTIQKNR